MRLENGFTVPVALDEAWAVLLDVEQLAPCMPGASVDSVDGDVVTGRVKVKIGPMTMTYQGTLKFHERDEIGRRVVLDAAANEVRGTGTASATVTATLTDDGGQTRVEVGTDLQITGRAAQFGRSVLGEISGRIIAQFADNLAAQLRTRAVPAPGPALASVAAPAMPAAAPAAAEAIDLMSAAGTPILKRVVPVLVGAFLLLVLARTRKKAAQPT